MTTRRKAAKAHLDGISSVRGDAKDKENVVVKAEPGECVVEPAIPTKKLVAGNAVQQKPKRGKATNSKAATTAKLATPKTKSKKSTDSSPSIKNFLTTGKHVLVRPPNANDYVDRTGIVPSGASSALSPTKTLKDVRKLPMSRVSGLDEEVIKCSEVALPEKLADIHFLFGELEKVVALKFALGQRVTLDQIKKNIAANCQRSFTDSMLAKILKVYPSAYSVKLEKDATVKPGQPPKHNLIVKPNLNDDLEPYYRQEYYPKSPVKPQYALPSGLVSPRKVQPQRDFIPSPSRSPRKSPVKPQIREVQLNVGPKFEGWRRTCRSAILRYKLYQHLTVEHDIFLAENKRKLAPQPGTVVLDTNPGPGLFHREFVPNEIRDISPVKLPEPEKVAKQKTMLDYLKSVPSSQILKSVEKVTQELSSPEKKVRLATERPPKNPETKMSLLDRIKAREKEAKEKQAKKDPKIMARISVLEELQLRSLAVICSEYNNRSSMEHGALFQRVNFSVQTRKVLTDVAGDHVSVEEVCKKKYVKVANNNIGTLMNKVGDELQRCKALIA